MYWFSLRGRFCFCRRWFIYSPIGAGEWGNPNSSYLKKKKCWENCKGSWRSGDVISDSVHVAIITDNKLTTSARHDKVVQNDWGFRSKGTGAKSSIKACWRYKYSCWTCPLSYTKNMWNFVFYYSFESNFI
jgi:hypothetical protein